MSLNRLLLQAEDAMGAIHRNLRMENQLIVDLIYTFLVRVGTPAPPPSGFPHAQVAERAPGTSVYVP